MPKYKNFLVYGYYLYFTSHCILEAFHVHASNKRLSEGGSAKFYVHEDASNKRLSEGGSAKFYVHEDGTSEVVKKGRISSKKLSLIQEFIKENYKDMYKMWLDNQGTPGFYRR